MSKLKYSSTTSKAPYNVYKLRNGTLRLNLEGIEHTGFLKIRTRVLILRKYVKGRVKSLHAYLLI